MAANSAPVTGVADGNTGGDADGETDGTAVGAGKGCCASACKTVKQNAAHKVAALAEKAFMARMISASTPEQESPPAVLLEPFVPGTALRN